MESIDKTINIRVEYKDLIKGMSESAKRQRGEESRRGSEWITRIHP